MASNKMTEDIFGIVFWSVAIVFVLILFTVAYQKLYNPPENHKGISAEGTEVVG